MKILLTGANGFVGSYLLDKYRLEYQIKTFSFLFDNFDSLDLRSINAIIHLSALVHQMDGANASEYEKVNVVQTLQLAKKAKGAGVRHFIFMSTVKVYGEESDTVYTETTPCHPRDDYGMSKLNAEQALQALEDEYFTVSIIRTPIVYGAGVKANIKNLINLIQKVPVLPFGNTNNQRSMVYIGNLCALIKSIFEQRASGIFLACDDTSLSTTQFIREITSALEKECYLVDIPFFENLLKHLKPTFHQRLFGNLIVDNTLTKQRLQFHNPYTVQEGIKRMIEGDCK
ncbi:MAG: NAD-dependent epimerase/dehydratase family protein [Sulfuricurvum sp.]|nr:NAD-dependent epimerase/dehydratase family protein [Sulfuricurvum sp.]MDP3023120.1 NAD-dependent epimerase/dehydratase family protein [Sulfuricurvum sp.]